MDPHKLAAKAIKDADAIVIGSGAGMSVDSGLPDFRGSDGFWNAYPPYKKLGIDFMSIANPMTFLEDPQLAWGFYGHRLEMYRASTPHDGYKILANLPKPKLAITSNVDGSFQRVGIHNVHEVHGNIHFLQEMNPGFHGNIWKNTHKFEIDLETMLAKDFPKKDGKVTRPNILMFSDPGFAFDRELEQQFTRKDWLNEHKNAKKVVIELGAGTAIPSIRSFCTNFAHENNCVHIRINLSEPKMHNENGISIEDTALSALRRIEEEMKNV